MKKIFILLVVLLLAGCGSVDNQKKEKVSEEKVKEEKVDKIDEIMKGMSLDEKIAQMLVIHYDGSTVDDNLKNILNSNPPSGFILLADNITDYEGTRNFVLNLKSNSKYPLIVSMDQEGGNVQRLNNFSDVNPTYIPFMYNLGKTNDTSLAYNTGRVMALEMRTIGINVDFAPVLDVFSNKNNMVIGKRSFGDNTSVVSDMAISLAKGLEDNSVIATYKHFPGHGDTDIDSHKSLPIINKNLDELDNLEFVPFKNAIKSGAKLIMIGHIALPSVTGDNTPATLSKKIIDILKNDLNYDGLIITDALNMGALTNTYSNEEIYVQAIDAGCDLLLMPNDGINTIEYIKNNVSEDRINESVKKILKFKYDYLDEDNFLDSSYLGNSEHKAIINQIPS